MPSYLGVDNILRDFLLKITYNSTYNVNVSYHLTNDTTKTYNTSIVNNLLSYITFVQGVSYNRRLSHI